MPKNNLINLEELAKLYTDYLKALSPDWSDERIAAEVRNVFQERKVTQSEKHRRIFQDSLLKKLEKIQKHPDDWFLTTNNRDVS